MTNEDRDPDELRPPHTAATPPPDGSDPGPRQPPSALGGPRIRERQAAYVAGSMRPASEIAESLQMQGVPGWFRGPSGRVNVRAAFAVTVDRLPGGEHSVVVQSAGGALVTLGVYSDHSLALGVADAVVRLAFAG